MIVRNTPDPIDNNLLYFVSRGLRGDRWRLNRFAIFELFCPTPETEKMLEQVTAEFLQTLSEAERAEWETLASIDPHDV